jgi:methionyl-tRNA formyltransferase
MIVESLAGTPGPGVVQEEACATYAPKITRQETVVDWTRGAHEIERAIRAFRPSPGITTKVGGNAVKLWRASLIDMTGLAGTVLRAEHDSIVVACGKGAVEITELQRAGAKRMPSADFLRGNPLRAGDRFT